MSITFPTTPWMVGAGVSRSVRVNLRYEPNADPYAVALIILERGEEPNPWLFARDLLRDGLTRAVCPDGGDVKITPGCLSVCVHLSGPTGRVLLLFDAVELGEFVRNVYLQCPVGSETARLDWSDTGEVLAG